MDQFIVNCVGWSHVLRCIEVIEMSMRDLIYKIVPQKIVVRELKTSTGKVLTKDSEYTLVERKKYIMVGKKTQVDYVFELDLKEEDNQPEEQKVKADKANQKVRNPFFMNLEDFSLFKLRSTIFLINFPLSFTLAIVSIWFKIMPEAPTTADNYTREEIDQIAQVKNSIREFLKNLNGHV